jgi:cytochrome c peroxidase
VQRNAFADPNRFSKGFDAKLTDRHAMSLVNLRYAPRGRFFWDERAESLEETVLVPIQSKLEMGQDLTKLVEVLAKDDRYPALFRMSLTSDRNSQRVWRLRHVERERVLLRTTGGWITPSCTSFGGPSDAAASPTC